MEYVRYYICLCNIFVMKTKIVLIGLLVVIMVTLNSLRIFQPIVGPHGGIVKQAGAYSIEMKENYPDFYAYLFVNNFKPVSNKGITCQARFILPDNTNIDVLLKPFGEDGFTAESGAFKFYSCRIYFNVFGKTVSAQFENENPIVQKK